MVEHNFHVLMGEAQVEEGHGTLSLRVALLVIEHLQVAVDIVDTHLREVDLGALLLRAYKAKRDMG